MDLHELTFLRLNLEELRHILLELTIQQDRIEWRGLWRVLDELTVRDKLTVRDELFDQISTQLVRLLRNSESIDSATSMELKQLLNETKLQDALAEIGITLQVAKRKRRPHRLIYLLPFSLVGKRNSLEPAFSKALAAISRLIPLLNALETIELNRKADDDGVFKPSGIDPRIVVARIDAAMQAVQEADNISTVQRVALITYLETAKTETKKEAPLWQKIVGILVITATILQGIAAAPDAVKNLHEALQYITGAASIPAPSPTLMLREFHREPDHEVQPEKPQQPRDRLTEV